VQKSRRPQQLSLRLTYEQPTRIVEALGGQPPSDPTDLKATLISLL
jgi:hypothetical protein